MKYCRECGKEVNEKAVVCIHCGCAIEQPKCNINKPHNKWIALLLWFFLGGFGGHKFYVGEVGWGITYLLSMTIGWFFIVPPIWIGIMLIIDLVNILCGHLNDVILEG